MEQHPKVLVEFTGDIKRLIRKFENVSRKLLQKTEFIDIIQPNMKEFKMPKYTLYNLIGDFSI